MAFWLVKSESNKYSIDDLKRDKVTHWSGVRNYQARNYLKAMKEGEHILYYHSVIDPLGVVGVARVVEEAIPDPTQFDQKSEYFDPKATKMAPRWFCPRLEFVERFPKILDMSVIRSLKGLDGMVLLQKRSRLSVQPVSSEQFKLVVEVARER